MTQEHQTSVQLLAEVRQPAYSSEVFLIRYKPNVKFQANINDSSITKGATTITYDNASGSYTDIEEGMTLLIGTTSLGREIGRVRVRSATSNTITVAPDDNIHYVDNAFLTVLEFYEFWPVFPRAELNTGTLTYTFYKDNDILYSDQNENLDPVGIIGPHFAGIWEIHTGIVFTATGSYTLDGSSIARVVWRFPTGSSIAAAPNNYIFTGTSPGFVTFPGPGNYTVRATVISSNGKSLSTYRHIAFVNEYIGTHTPIRDWELDSLSGEWGVGWNAKFKVREGASQFKDGDLVFLISDDTYGDVTKGSFNRLSIFRHRQHSLFVGYVHYIENTYSYLDSESMIFVKGITSYMQNKEMFSIEMTDNSNPTDWTHIQNLDINKAIHHYFRWHSTLYKMTDVRPIETIHGNYDENTIQIQKGEIYNTINNFLNQRVFGAFTSDEVGRCFAEVDLNMIVTGSRPPSELTLLDTDWINAPTFIERIELPLSNVTMGGEAYEVGTTETGTAYLSRAPGDLQTYVGKSENVSGLSLPSSGQSIINILSGLYFAKHNNRLPEVVLDLAVNLRTIDIAPQAFYNFVIDGNRTHRNLQINTRLIPRKITRKLENFSLRTNIYFEPETYGPPGDTIIIPTEPPDGSTDCDDDPDNCNPPCANGCDDDDDDPSDNPQGGTVYVATSTKIGRTETFLESSPSWADITNGLTNIVDMVLDPYDPANSAVVLTTTAIYTTNNLASASPTWTQRLTRATIRSEIGNSDLFFYNVSASITSQGLYFVSLYQDNGADTSGHHVAVRTTDYFSTHTATTIATHGPGLAGALTKGLIQASNINSSYGYYIIMLGGQSQGFYRTTNSNGSWTNISGFAAFAVGGPFDAGYAGANETSEQIIFALQASPPRIYRSTDGGPNLGEISTLDNGLVIDAHPARLINVATMNADDVMFIMPDDGIFESDDGGDTFTELVNLSGGTFTQVCGFGRWPFDLNRVYFLCTEGIMTSADKGVTLVNKLGNWETVMGEAWDSGVNLIPVWTI